MSFAMYDHQEAPGYEGARRIEPFMANIVIRGSKNGEATYPKPAQTLPTDVRDAGDRGTGLFACELIPQQTLIIEYTGNRIGPKEKEELLRQGSVYIFQVGPKEFVDASVPNRLNLARHINHSCSPNAAVEIWDGSAGAARALVISRRNIHPNEEITIHYGRSSNFTTFLDNPNWYSVISSLRRVSATEAQSEPEWELGAETFIQIRKCGYVEGEDIVLSYNFAEQMTGPKPGVMWDGNTTYNEGLNQIWSQSDELIESYGISDRDPERVNINFLRPRRLAFSSRPSLRQFFAVLRVFGLVLFL
ncbi:hypothetical protein B0H13DRAFT_2315957 [Mycena leptocephala]|nr:hypothetical protein B0H13DRAFT_2315957 [Mycena leptocephala]